MARAGRARSGPHSGSRSAHPGIGSEPPNPAKFDGRRFRISSPVRHQRLGRHLARNPGFHQSGKSVARGPETERDHRSSWIRAPGTASRVPGVRAPRARSRSRASFGAGGRCGLGARRGAAMVDPAVASILDKALSGGELDVAQGERLFIAAGEDLRAIIAAADDLRRRKVGERVTYVVNRNINFTNVCVKRCGFCAFSRGHRAEEGYFLPVEEVVRRAKEAWELGATEVCIQAGLPPRIPGSFYIDLCAAIKREIPQIHVHAFSPEEILYGATLSNRTFEDYLAALKDVGLGSLPGTSAEILDDRVREIISPGRISTRDWVEVIRTAHKLGIPTTSTIMYGHIETALDRAKHLDLIRS